MPPNNVTQLRPKRKGRGPAKKPRLVGTSLRLPAYVLEFYRTEFPFHMQLQMRAVLTKFADDMLEIMQGRTQPKPEAAPGAAQQPENEGASQ